MQENQGKAVNKLLNVSIKETRFCRGIKSYLEPETSQRTVKGPDSLERKCAIFICLKANISANKANLAGKQYQNEGINIKSHLPPLFLNSPKNSPTKKELPDLVQPRIRRIADQFRG